MTRAAVALAVVAAIVALALPAHATEFDPGGGFGQNGQATYGGRYSSDGTTGSSGNRPVIDYGYVKYTVQDGPAQPGSLNGLCAYNSDPQRPGYTFHIIGTDVAHNIVDDHWVCWPLDQGTTPILPQPPTVEELWKSAQIPHPIVVTDPRDRGITGLETRIKSDGPRSLTITVEIRGYQVVGTVRLDHYTISIDGAPARVADHDAFTFETKGSHRIEIAAVWVGTATVTGPDIQEPIFLNDIGQATLTTTRTYPVHEIRSVLQP